MKSYKNLVRLLAGAVVLYAGSASAATFMDQFVDPTNPNQFIRDDVFMNGDMSVSNQSTGPFDSILGGFRDLEISIESSEDVSPQSGAIADVFGGILRFSNDTGIDSELKLTYDGDDDASSINYSGLDVDLTQGGTSSGFKLNVISADLGFSVKADLYSRDGASSSFSYQFDEGVTNEELFFTLDTFDGSADLTDIGAVQFTFAGSEDLDLRVGPIEMTEEIAIAEVPEPTSLLALAGVSALGAACGRRKCKS